MKRKIVMDSAGDLQTMEGVAFSCVPLKIVTESREFVDDAQVDTQEMITYLRQYKGKTTTACPGVGEYLEAFADADEVYCVTITSGLSGSYNAATVAAQTYLEQHPDRRVHVFDSLSAGAEMSLIAQKLAALLNEGLAFEQIVQQVQAYQKRTRLVFSLESLHNLANNGRVSWAVAKVVGVLGLRLIGIASDEGTLQPTGKARGEKKVVPELVKKLLDMGYAGGRLSISHCCNEKAALELKQAILDKFPRAQVQYRPTKALCSFYAEAGGLLVGFEAC